MKNQVSIGLTGGIGSGKSTVASFFAERGARVINADAISHQVTAVGGAAIAPIAKTFGAQVIDPDGALDRVAMRELIYCDPQARARLETIIHPLVRAAMAQQAAAARQAGCRWVVLDIPLLVEGLARWRSQLDRIVVVDCPPETQIARVMARSRLTRNEVARIIAAQSTREQRLAAADHVIHNGPEVTLDALAARVRQFIDSLSGL